MEYQNSEEENKVSQQLFVNMIEELNVRNMQQFGFLAKQLGVEIEGLTLKAKFTKKGIEYETTHPK